MKRLIAISGLIIMILSVLTGCTGVAEVPVDDVVAVVTGASEDVDASSDSDLSLYIIEEPAKEDPEPIPLDPNLAYINTEEFSKLMESASSVSKRSSYSEYPADWNFVVVDARPSKVYDEGHINGAINIPAAEFNQYKQLLPEDKDKLIVFYCGGLQCGLSKKAALEAEKLGYTNVMVYQEGTPFWTEAGNYLTVTPEYVNQLMMESYVTREDYPPYIILDARPYTMYFDEHIPNAIQVDDNLFAQKYLDMMPSNKGTEIVVYCGGFTCGKSHKVADILIDNGYTNVKVMAGGVPAWKANQLPTFGMKSTGGSFNVSEGKVNRGLTPVQFEEKMKQSNIAVLDVRTAEERSHGAIEGSIHIPDSDIHADPKAIADKLPKDKNTTILIHCASGARASGVVNKIADLGYPNTFYLDNKIIISSDGNYSF